MLCLLCPDYKASTALLSIRFDGPKCVHPTRKYNKVADYSDFALLALPEDCHFTNR